MLMKFTTSQGSLAAALAAVAKVTPSNPMVPSLAAAVLEVVDRDGVGSLTVTGGDGENWVRTTVPLSGEFESGVVAVAGRLAADLAKDLPDAALDCAVENGKFSIDFGSGSCALPVFADVTVSLPSLDADAFVVSGDSLASAASRVAVAASRKESLPILECIRLELDAEALVLAATDRYRLSSVSVPLPTAWENDPVSVNVLAAEFVPAVKLLAKSPQVSVRMSETLVSLSDGSTEVFLRAIGGDFPKWRTLLSSTTPSTWIQVDPSTLLMPVRRSARLSGDLVSVTFDEAEAEVSGADASLGSAVERVAISRSEPGETITMRFAAQYLMDGLASFGDREVSLGVSSAERALLVKDTDGAVHLVMPRR